MKNKALKRVLSVLLCVCVFCFSFTVTAFADISIDDVIDTQFSNWSELPDDFKALGEAYYNALVQSDSLGSWFKNASEVPISWYKVLKDGTPVLSPVSKIFYTIDDFGNLFVDDYHSDGGRHRADSVVVPATDFKDYLDNTSYQYFPKNASGKMSFRTDSRFLRHLATISGTYDTYIRSTLYDGTSFCALGDNAQEIYAVRFYKTNESAYYGLSQLHFVMTITEHWFEDRDEIEYLGYTLTCEHWDMINGDRTESKTLILFDDVQYQYFDLGRDSYGFSIAYYDSLINYNKYSVKGEPGPSRDIPSSLVYTPDLSLSLDIRNIYKHFRADKGDLKLTAHDDICDFNGLCDFGYIASATPITMEYSIDTTKIPDNYYITISGDTVYDYSITNPETGQSDTINNYITNNYTYVTNNNPGSGSGSGLGGNITVDGKVEVGGTVGVDINVKVPDININVNQGNVGGGDNLGDYVDTSGSVTEIGGVISKLPELSKGFTDYLKGFFTWLPTEIYGLIVLILVISVFNAIRSRR